jgi:hypothetical protein
MRSGCAIVTRIHLRESNRNKYKTLCSSIRSNKSTIPGRDTYQLTSCNGLVFPLNNTRLGRVTSSMTTSVMRELTEIVGQTMITDILSYKRFWHSSLASLTELNTLCRPGPFILLHGITHQSLQTLSANVYRIFPGIRVRNRQTNLKIPLHRRPRHAYFPLLCERCASALASPSVTAETTSWPRGGRRGWRGKHEPVNRRVQLLDLATLSYAR